MNSGSTVLGGINKAIEETYSKNFTRDLIDERFRAESQKVFAQAKSDIRKLNGIKPASGEGVKDGVSGGLTVIIGSGFEHTEGDGGVVGQVIWHGSIPELLAYAKKQLNKLEA